VGFLVKAWHRLIGDHQIEGVGFGFEKFKCFYRAGPRSDIVP
jgi:hypothetical protein